MQSFAMSVPYFRFIGLVFNHLGYEVLILYRNYPILDANIGEDVSGKTIKCADFEGFTPES